MKPRTLLTRPVPPQPPLPRVPGLLAYVNCDDTGLEPKGGRQEDTLPYNKKVVNV